MDFFAGTPVREFAVAKDWYERFFGVPPSFLPNDIEAVWELAEHRYTYIIELPERAGHSLQMVWVDELDKVIEGLAERGFEPAEQEDFENGVRKVTYRDPDGNEFSYGGAPTEA